MSELKNRIYLDFVASFENAIAPLQKSFFEILSNAMAGVSKLLYIYLDNIQKDSFLNSCTDSRVLNYFAPLNNLTLKEATKSSGTVTFTGVDTTIIPSGTKVIYNGSLEFQTTANGTITGGTVDIVCESVGVGALNNTIGNISLFLSVPVSGVDNTALSTLGFSGAIDDESIGSLRNRTITKQGKSPQIDNGNYYKSLGNEVANVKATFISELKNGVGTFGVTILTQGNNGVPIQADIDAVETHFINESGVPIYVTAEYFLPIIVSQNFDILLSVNNITNQQSIEEAVRDYLYTFQKAGDIFAFLGLSKILQNLGARLVSPAPNVTLAIALDEVVDVGTITWS
ncbi:MAG: baseplate J/gp47 family protein [Bacteroidetes bacterium]|nr:baseplate J/gp47 family protein [Bacteroidota bacterium]